MMVPSKFCFEMHFFASSAYHRILLWFGSQVSDSGTWESPVLVTGNHKTLIRLFIEIWFPTNNLSCGWRIILKVWYNVCNYKRKVGIEFGGCGPYRLSKRGQKGEKWVIFKNHCRMFIFNAILMILSLLYSL